MALRAAAATGAETQLKPTGLGHKDVVPKWTEGDRYKDGLSDLFWWKFEVRCILLLGFLVCGMFELWGLGFGGADSQQNFCV